MTILETFTDKQGTLWEMVEDVDTCGICHACQEWSSPVGIRIAGSADRLEDVESSCCGGSIEMF